MKTTAYILLIIAATALASCDESLDTEYVRQDKLEIKTFPITPLVLPHLLPDGSLAIMEKDSEVGATPNAEPQMPEQASGASYHLIKLSKDGTITKSPKLTYTLGQGTTTGLDFERSHTADINVTADNNFAFKYIGSNSYVVVSKFDTGAYIEEKIADITNGGKFAGCAPLDDGSYAFVHGKNPVMSIYDKENKLTNQIQLPYIFFDATSKYMVCSICGNIMIINGSGEEKYEFYVYSPTGQLLNYGTYYDLPDRIINIVDPVTNTFSHAYATIDDVWLLNENDEIQKGCLLMKLDQKGRVIYRYESLEQTEILNVTEHDGKLIIAGNYTSQSLNDIVNVNDITRVMSSFEGKIVTLDAATGQEISIQTLSLEGGIMPFAVVPDDKGGYYVYMSRIFSHEVGQMGIYNEYGNSIFIYHVNDLNKLNNE